MTKPFPVSPDPSQLALVRQLANEPLADLIKEAARRRDQAFGRRITFSPKVFIPLTFLCRDKCGYCTFAKAPKRIPSPFMELEEVLEVARKGAALRCTEALFTLGQAPEDRYALAREWLARHGYSSTLDYLHDAAKAVLEDTGLLPHLNPGTLSEDELLRLKEVSASQGMMLETIEDLPAHRGCPDKEPRARVEALIAAGRARVPFTTGLLVGIGESLPSSLEALLLVNAINRKWGHIQEVIIQPFAPKPGTAMRNSRPCEPEVLLRVVASARILLDDSIHLQSPPNLAGPYLKDLLEAGIDDLGGISPLTPDYVNPEAAWPELEDLGRALGAWGYQLVPRLPLYPEFVQKEGFVSEKVLPFLRAASDSSGYARFDLWSPGKEVAPPPLSVIAFGEGSSDEVREILEAALSGEDLEQAQIVRLFEARGKEVRLVMEAADELRREIAGEAVTFVRNRNINYTNICTFRCRFCAFSKGPLSLNLRGTPYLLSLDQIVDKAVEAWQAGATEVCLQGGIHPSFDGEYYLSVVRAIRQALPDIHIHAFSALEVFEGARRLSLDLEDYLSLLFEAGLRSLPGTAAEILDDEVRRVICPDKIDTATWLAVHEAAHKVGLKSNVTIMFGSVEGPSSWAKHLLVTKELASRTGGFTEFVPLPFVHMGAPIYLMGKARKGPTMREALLMHAVGRLVYGSVIPNVQTSWVKMGPQGAAMALKAGANDLGGTLMEENISRAAGASHGSAMEAEDLQKIAEAAGGRPLLQRTTLYQVLTPK